MTSFLWTGTILAEIYGLLSVVTGAFQIKVRKIPMWSAICMTILGGVILTSALLALINSKIIIILLLCFLCLQVIAVINGLYLYGKINITHHFIRFCISVIIIILFIS
jgi:hypothetical protein